MGVFAERGLQLGHSARGMDLGYGLCRSWRGLKDDTVVSRQGAKFDSRKRSDDVGASSQYRVLSTIRTGRGEATVRLEIVDPFTGEAELTRDCGQARNGRVCISNKHIVVVSAEL